MSTNTNSPLTKTNVLQFMKVAIMNLENQNQIDETIDMGFWNPIIKYVISQLVEERVGEICDMVKNVQKESNKMDRNIEKLQSKFEGTLEEVISQKVMLEREVKELRSKNEELQNQNTKIQNKLASTTVAKEKLEAKLNNNLSPKKGK
jgi:predicted RNase H-like nuclease (RuvC/YqgF family)